MEEWLLKAVSGITTGSASGWLLVLLAVIYINRDRREDRKLSAGDREALRAGFAQEVADLRKENREQRDEMQAIRHAADDARKLCQAENDQLRDEIVLLEQRFSGVMRKMADLAVRASRGEVDPGMVDLILTFAQESGAKK